MSISELNRAMRWLADKPNTLFVGQAVAYPGQAAFKTFEGVPMERRIEMPVAEEFQMGFCTGLSLQGYLPIAFYPRWDFLLLASNQLVNHLDKLPQFGWTPKMIIRVGIGTTSPLDPGPQHCQNHSYAFREMLKTVKIYEIVSKHDIMPAYRWALDNDNSTIIVEPMSLYRDK